MPSKSYTKQWIPYEAQVQKLEERGLQINDRPKAIRFLSHLNYYRFSGYCLAFEKQRHTFEKDTTFEQIVEAYHFDKGLRELMIVGLGQIEVELRALIAYEFGRSYGAFGHYDFGNFYTPNTSDELAKATSDHSNWVNGLGGEVGRSKEKFVTHFESSYQEHPKLPIWMVTELMSFGATSRMLSALKTEDKKKISTKYKIQPKVFCSWIHHLVYVRNICAHHSRLWDKFWSIKPELPPSKTWRKLDGEGNLIIKSHRLLATLFIIRYMLKRSTGLPEQAAIWKKRVEVHMENPPTVSDWMAKTGFVDNWRLNPIWN